MSIAISATIKPSKILLAMIAMQCLMVAAIGILVGVGIVGPLTLAGRLGLAAICLLGALFGIVHYCRSSRPVRIDISGTGQIRIADIALKRTVTALPKMPLVAHLLGGSTLWAHLLLLRFRLDGGQVRTIAILPDCVPDEIFRALSVACRWIALRTHAADPDGLADE
ncbi:flagellar hook-length control protein [Paraherbaspirillum soli]|uniref:Flagellar hook-length control protein n=1 Tax=Paraherbaspirillum soli TaxID=631222 RepID=A0ABW0MD32_9BURK